MAERSIEDAETHSHRSEAFVDDRRVYHGVTPVEPLDPAHEAHRDVLVVTFAREP